MSDLLQGCLLQVSAMFSGMLGLTLLLSGIRNVGLFGAPLSELVPGAFLVAVSAFLFKRIYDLYVSAAVHEIRFRQRSTGWRAPRSAEPRGRSPAPASESYVPDCLRRLDLDASCSLDDVKRAYRARARDLHPDVGGDPEAFIELETAYRSAIEVVRRRARLRPAPGVAGAER
jgi:hypothetical protein